MTLFVQAHCKTMYFLDPMAHTALDDTITAFKPCHGMDVVSDCWQYQVIERAVPVDGVSYDIWATWSGATWSHFMCHEAQPSDFQPTCTQAVYVPPDSASLRSDCSHLMHSQREPV